MAAGADSSHVGGSWTSNATRFVLVPAGAATTVVSLQLAADNPHTTFTGLGSAWRWSAAAAAAALLAAGFMLSQSGRRGYVATGVLALLWWVPDWAGWLSWPVLARTASDTVTAILPVASVVVATAVLGSPERDRRTLLALATTGAALRALTRLILVDPFLDPECWRDCQSNPATISTGTGLARLADRLGTAALIAAAIGVVVSAVATRPTRSRNRASIVTTGAAAALVVGTTLGEALRRTTFDSQGGTALRSAFVIATVAALAFAAGLAADRVGQWRLRVALTRMVDQLRTGPEPGMLERAMAQEVGDPDLRIAFWYPVQGGWVDTNGETTPVPSTQTGGVTRVVRGGQQIAAITHRAGAATAIEDAMGPAMRLWIENEQLRAATLAELAELQASRARLVERSDQARRQLERNLHDGAQQRVVGMALLLRMLRNRLDSANDGAEDRDHVVRAEYLVEALLADLRRIGRGIHPGILATEGLRAAVSALADSSDVTVRIDRLPTGRYAPSIEAAAYLVVAEATQDARRRAANTVTIDVDDQDSTLVVEVADDAASDAEQHSVHDLDDRVLAVGGRLVVDATGTTGTRVRIELPCA